MVLPVFGWCLILNDTELDRQTTIISHILISTRHIDEQKSSTTDCTDSIDLHDLQNYANVL